MNTNLRGRAGVLLAVSSLLFGACLPRSGDPSGHVSITLPGAALDAGPAVEAGSLPAPALRRLSLRVEGPGFPPLTSTIDPAARSFELDIPAGPQRTLSLIGEELRGADLTPTWYGAVTFDLQPGQTLDLVIPVVPAGTLSGALWLAGARLPAQVQVKLAADAARPGTPAILIVQTDANGAFQAVLPTGSYAVGLLVEDALAGLRPQRSDARAKLGQGERLEVAIELVPLSTVSQPAALVLELVGGFLAGLPSPTPGDLWLRVRDAGGAPAALKGTVTFADSDLALLKVPPDVTLHGESEKRLGGAVQALVAAGAATLRARVRELPSVRGSLVVNILGGGVLPGAARSLRLELPVLQLPTGLLARGLDLRVTALDAAGLVATGYQGTVSFAASDTLALLVPPDYAFRSPDSGSHLFVAGVRGIGLPGLGATLRARDKADPSIQGQLSVTLVAP